MSLSLALIIRVVIVLILVYVAAKVFGSFFANLYENFSQGKKRKNFDLDSMIEQKKNEFRHGEYGEMDDSFDNPSSKKGKKEKVTYPSKTEEEYAKFFKKLSKNGEVTALSNIKSMFILFDNVKWGSGKLYSQMQSSISKHVQAPVEIDLISKAINSLLRFDVLISLKHAILPSFEEIEKVVESRVIIEILVSESKKNTGEYLSRLSKKFQTQDELLARSIDLIVLKETDQGEQGIYNSILSDPSSSQILKHPEDKIEKVMSRMLISKDKKTFLLKEDIYQMLMEENDLLSAIYPIEKVKSQNDLEGAFKIFQIDPETPLAKIKKRYKRIASSKHPDRLSGKGIPDNIIKQANENFSNIQEAYQIIIKAKSQKT